MIQMYDHGHHAIYQHILTIVMHDYHGHTHVLITVNVCAYLWKIGINLCLQHTYKAKLGLQLVLPA